MIDLLQPLEDYETRRGAIEQERPSTWAGHTETIVPKLLPAKIGDGASYVMLSFYGAPEIVVVVPFDSKLPLDLNMPERGCESDTLRSFRDAVDSIVEEIRETFEVSTERAESLKEGLDAAELEEFDAWAEILRDGSTWAYFPAAA